MKVGIANTIIRCRITIAPVLATCSSWRSSWLWKLVLAGSKDNVSLNMAASLDITLHKSDHAEVRGSKLHDNLVTFDFPMSSHSYGSKKGLSTLYSRLGPLMMRSGLRRCGLR